MELYIKTKNKFMLLSLVVLITSGIVIFLLKLEALGYFLLGIFASAFIITMQYSLASKIEESKLLVEKLKKIYHICFDFDEFDTFSVEYFSLYFDKKFNTFNEKLSTLFTIKDELANIEYLKKSTKKELDRLIKRIDELEVSLYFIFKNFDSSTNKMKIIYFIEFYNIMRDFEFRKFINVVSDLGWKIDSNEFYARSASERKERTLKSMEYKTSIDIYNKKLEEKNSGEYKALRTKFERSFK